jgi:hypothetical protein
VNVVVNRVESDNSSRNISAEWTITVIRLPENAIFDGFPPLAQDLPEDVRAGLRNWIDTTH